MFEDSGARRAWRLYFLRAEAVLSPLSATIRQELIEDLKSHVREILAIEPNEGDELTRLKAALARVGEPREFLAPLLADAVFRAPPQTGSLKMAYNTLTLYAARGTTYALRALALVVVAAMGTAVGLAALNSLLRPDRAGLFATDADTYQLRILGLSPGTGDQLLAPWMALLLIIIGAALVVWTAARVRKMLLELIAA